MCFRDLELREHELDIVGSAATAIRSGAQKAGHKRIEFIDAGMMRELYDPACSPGVCLEREIFPVHRITFAAKDRRVRSPQTYAHIHLVRSTILLRPVHFYHIAPLGYESMLLIIPSEDLRSAFFPTGCSSEHRMGYVPLDFEPSDPLFPFLKYRDNWSAVEI